MGKQQTTEPQNIWSKTDKAERSNTQMHNYSEALHILLSATDIIMRQNISKNIENLNNIINNMI